MSKCCDSAISVIIPIYNAGKYLEYCLESIVRQVTDSDEIILVDDGSTDQSSQICDLYCNRYPQMLYVKQNNAGASAARNAGVKRATKEWVCFIDADDEIADDSLKAVRRELSSEIDMLYLNYIKGNDIQNFTHKVTTLTPEQLIDASLDYVGTKKQMSNVMVVQPMLYAACWGKIYKRKIMIDNKLLFYEDLKLSEDLCFNLCYLRCTHIIRAFDYGFYKYRVNQQSVTHTFDHSHIISQRKLAEHLREISDGRSSEFRLKTNVYITRSILRLNENICAIQDDGCVKEYKDLIGDGIITEALKGIRFEQLSDSFIQSIVYYIILNRLRKEDVSNAVLIGRCYQKLREVKRKGIRFESRNCDIS